MLSTYLEVRSYLRPWLQIRAPWTHPGSFIVYLEAPSATRREVLLPYSYHYSWRWLWKVQALIAHSDLSAEILKTILETFHETATTFSDRQDPPQGLMIYISTSLSLSLPGASHPLCLLTTSSLASRLPSHSPHHPPLPTTFPLIIRCHAPLLPVWYLRVRLPWQSAEPETWQHALVTLHVLSCLIACPHITWKHAISISGLSWLSGHLGVPANPGSQFRFALKLGRHHRFGITLPNNAKHAISKPPGILGMHVPLVLLHWYFLILRRERVARKKLRYRVWLHTCMQDSIWEGVASIWGTSLSVWSLQVRGGVRKPLHHFGPKNSISSAWILSLPAQQSSATSKSFVGDTTASSHQSLCITISRRGVVPLWTAKPAKSISGRTSLLGQVSMSLLHIRLSSICLLTYK